MLLRVVGDHLGVEYCGFVFQKGCPLRRIVSDRSRALFETGHMSHWTDVTLRITLPEHLRPEYLGSATLLGSPCSYWNWLQSLRSAPGVVDYGGAVGWLEGGTAPDNGGDFLAEAAWTRW
ncbi:hypothetical protein V5799_007600 [Amblyomma americanum]|uniref:Uncharacterized protein n=1 Tax=Amblyomma americanum TaxID=6943 RepID=A0AAQ4FFG1_AMBAM